MGARISLVVASSSSLTPSGSAGNANPLLSNAVAKKQAFVQALRFHPFNEELQKLFHYSFAERAHTNDLAASKKVQHYKKWVEFEPTFALAWWELAKALQDPRLGETNTVEIVEKGRITTFNAQQCYVEVLSSQNSDNYSPVYAAAWWGLGRLGGVLGRCPGLDDWCDAKYCFERARNWDGETVAMLERAAGQTTKGISDEVLQCSSHEQALEAFKEWNDAKGKYMLFCPHRCGYCANDDGAGRKELRDHLFCVDENRCRRWDQIHDVEAAAHPPGSSPAKDRGAIERPEEQPLPAFRRWNDGKYMLFCPRRCGYCAEDDGAGRKELRGHLFRVDGHRCRSWEEIHDVRAAAHPPGSSPAKDRDAIENPEQQGLEAFKKEEMLFCPHGCGYSAEDSVEARTVANDGAPVIRPGSSSSAGILSANNSGKKRQRSRGALRAEEQEGERERGGNIGESVCRCTEQPQQELLPDPARRQEEVEILNISSRPELNGQRGWVVEKLDNGRYGVEVVNLGGKLISFARKNLRPTGVGRHRWGLGGDGPAGGAAAGGSEQEALQRNSVRCISTEPREQIGGTSWLCSWVTVLEAVVDECKAMGWQTLHDQLWSVLDIPEGGGEGGLVSGLAIVDYWSALRVACLKDLDSPLCRCLRNSRMTGVPRREMRQRLENLPECEEKEYLSGGRKPQLVWSAKWDSKKDERGVQNRSVWKRRGPPTGRAQLEHAAKEERLPLLVEFQNWYMVIDDPGTARWRSATDAGRSVVLACQYTLTERGRSSPKFIPGKFVYNPSCTSTYYLVAH